VGKISLRIAADLLRRMIMIIDIVGFARGAV
jgi:hypothetical protein